MTKAAGHAADLDKAESTVEREGSDIAGRDGVELHAAEARIRRPCERVLDQRPTDAAPALLGADDETSQWQCVRGPPRLAPIVAVPRTVSPPVATVARRPAVSSQPTRAAASVRSVSYGSVSPSRTAGSTTRQMPGQSAERAFRICVRA